MNKPMNRLIFALTICTFMCFGCTSSLSSGYKKGSAQWEVATFIQNINSGKHEEALKQFRVNPLENEEITVEEFKNFTSERITKGNTVTAIELTETPEEFDPNMIRVNVNFTYSDGSAQTLWVDAQNIDGVWKITTRGSMF